MKAAKTISAIFTIFIVMPIWYYLLYQILKAINASELMFFLFWIYIPTALFSAIIAKITEDND